MELGKNHNTMEKTKYTPEPWRLHKHAYAGIESIQSRMIASCGSHSNNQDGGKAHRENEYNAKRIVECVNALAGIENPDEWVEKMKEYDKKPEYVKILDTIDLDKLNFEGLWKREKEFNAQLQTENEALQQMRQDYARVTADLVIVKSENDNIKKDYVALCQSHEEIQSENERLKANVLHYEINVCADLDREIESLKAELKSLKEFNEVIIRERDWQLEVVTPDLNDQIQSLKAELAKLKGE